MSGLGAWMLALGKPLVIGLVALASTLAVLGYVAVQVAWRAYVVAAWRPARRRRRARDARGLRRRLPGRPHP